MKTQKIFHWLSALLVCIGALLDASPVFALSSQGIKVEKTANETKVAAHKAKKSGGNSVATTSPEVAEMNAQVTRTYEALISKANTLSRQTREWATKTNALKEKWKELDDAGKAKAAQELAEDRATLKPLLFETYELLEAAANEVYVIDMPFEDRLMDSLGAVADALDTILDGPEKTLANRKFLASSFRGHYRLKRRVFAVSLTRSPAVRIQCQVQTARGSDTVVFDPQSSGAWTRYAILPKNDKLTSLTCTSDHIQAESAATGSGTGSSQFYEFVEEVVVSVPTGLAAPLKTLTGRWSSTLSGGIATNSGPQDLTVTVSHVPPLQELALLRQITSINPTSTLRSLDPSTLAMDLITSLSTIAIERASEAAKDYVRTYLVENLCENLTIEKLREKLDGSPLAQGLGDLPKDQSVLQTTCGVLKNIRLDELASAKDVLWKAIAIDASRLAVEAAESQIRMTGGLSSLASMTAVLRAAHSVLTHSLSGDRAGTEREVQAMLLNLGSVGVRENEAWACGLEAGIAVLRLCLRDNTCSADELDLLIAQEDSGTDGATSKLSPSVVNRTVGAYMQFYWDTEAAAKAGDKDKFDAAELKLKNAESDLLSGSHASAQSECRLSVAINQWPALRPLVGRIGDVLQPPPGTPAGITTANALEVVVDVAQEVLKQNLNKNLAVNIKKPSPSADSPKCRLATTKCSDLKLWKDRAHSLNKTLTNHLYATMTLNALTKFIVILRGEDPSPAIAEFGQALSLTIARWCETENNSTCKVPVTSAQIERAFKVLTAIGSYAASYREAKNEGESIDEKTRAEERKKALKSVIDAFTDRSSRTNEWVFSLGASVGFQLAGMHSFTSALDSEDHRGGVLGNVFTLPMGVGVQHYPENCWAKFHGMVVLLDPAQYLTVNQLQAEAKFAEPTPLTAVHLGLQAGLHFGSPNFPLVATVHVGWSPELRLFRPDETTGDDLEDGKWISHSALTYGANLGIYVPFFDFN